MAIVQVLPSIFQAILASCIFFFCVLTVALSTLSQSDVEVALFIDVASNSH